MKISEAIEKLTALKNSFGDLNCYVERDGDTEHLNSIERKVEIDVHSLQLGRYESVIGIKLS